MSCLSFVFDIISNVNGVIRGGLKIDPATCYKKFSGGGDFVQGVQPLKYSPGGRPLEMGDPGNGGPWEWRAVTLLSGPN